MRQAEGSGLHAATLQSRHHHAGELFFVEQGLQLLLQRRGQCFGGLRCGCDEQRQHDKAQPEANRAKPAPSPQVQAAKEQVKKDRETVKAGKEKLKADQAAGASKEQLK